MPTTISPPSVSRQQKISQKLKRCQWQLTCWNCEWIQALWKQGVCSWSIPYLHSQSAGNLWWQFVPHPIWCLGEWWKVGPFVLATGPIHLLPTNPDSKDTRISHFRFLSATHSSFCTPLGLPEKLPHIFFTNKVGVPTTTPSKSSQLNQHWQWHWALHCICCPIVYLIRSLCFVQYTHFWLKHNSWNWLFTWRHIKTDPPSRTTQQFFNIYLPIDDVTPVYLMLMNTTLQSQNGQGKPIWKVQSVMMDQGNWISFHFMIIVVKFGKRGNTFHR